MSEGDKRKRKGVEEGEEENEEEEVKEIELKEKGSKMSDLACLVIERLLAESARHSRPSVQTRRDAFGPPGVALAELPAGPPLALPPSQARGRAAGPGKHPLLTADLRSDLLCLGLPLPFVCLLALSLCVLPFWSSASYLPLLFPLSLS